MCREVEHYFGLVDEGMGMSEALTVTAELFYADKSNKSRDALKDKIVRHPRRVNKEDRPKFSFSECSPWLPFCTDEEQQQLMQNTNFSALENAVLGEYRSSENPQEYTVRRVHDSLVVDLSEAGRELDIHNTISNNQTPNIQNMPRHSEEIVNELRETIRTQHNGVVYESRNEV